MGQDSSRPQPRLSQAKTAGDMVAAMAGEDYRTDGSGENPAAIDPRDLVAKIDKIPKSDYSSLLSFVESQAEKLRQDITVLSKNGNSGFNKLYQSARPTGANLTCDAAKTPSNVPLNRYNNVLPYDQTRVTITPSKDTYNSDYINANWIRGNSSPKEYIATQGPIPTSFVSFWQMLWENKAHIIVMLTNEIEDGKLKCHRYWPTEEDGTIQYGNVIVTLQQERVHRTYIERHFALSNASAPTKTMPVVQLAYTAWPDHGVPATTQALLEFRRIIHEFHQSFGAEGPLIMHCSAGVGRTGTLIGLDRYLNAAAQKKDVQFVDIVTDMRSCRNLMVQSLIQFVFLYLASLDGLERLAAVLRRKIELEAMSPEERQEAELAELQAQITHEVNVVGTIKGLRQHKRGDARSMFDSEATDAAPTNMPSLQHRLEALQGAYKAAQTNWAGSGETYAVDMQLSPLESRIQSLSNANQAWDARVDANTTTMQEASALEKLAGLTARLESLHAVIVSDEARWRQRGHGFRDQQQTEEQSSRRHHTVETIGNLMDRVQMLAADQEALMNNTKRVYQGVETFKAEVNRERAAQERRHREIEKQREEEEQRRRQREQQAKEEAETAAKMMEAMKLEEERRKQIRDRMKMASQPQPSPAEQSLQARRRNLTQQAEEAERKKREEEARAKAEAEKQARESKKAAVEVQRTQSLKKANAFLSKITQQPAK